jgi:kumamolisin
MAAQNRFASQKRVALSGSERKPVEGGEPAEKKATGNVMVSVIVRRTEPIATRQLGKPGSRMTRAEFARRHGPDAASVKLVKAFAKEFGLAVAMPKEAGRRTIHLTGSAAAMQTAFGVELKQHTINGKKYRVREGSICLPEELSGQVEAVLGLDNRPQAKPHNRVATPHATNVQYTPVQVAELYSFPANPSAAGETIGLIELGGGYKTADLKAYFKTLGLAVPTVTAVLVDGGKNAPSNANSADGEVMLDIEVSAAVAPGAKIAVYFTPNTDQGFIDAISTAVHDTTNKPSVISISWGGPESTWTAQSMTALDSACQAAAALGVTITVAVGDNGSTDGVAGTTNHVDFPASSPHVLACGGTKLVVSGSTITSETVWNELAANEGATGGGVSDVFPLPSWQTNTNVPVPTVAGGGRGVPDVAGDADPSTGYTIRVDGETLPIGGTSAVAPLWAGLIALANAANGVSAGFVNPTFYASGAAKAFHDITQGDNPAFSAGPGWDACSGLGSPIGTAIIAALKPKSATRKTAKKAVKKAVKK